MDTPAQAATHGQSGVYKMATLFWNQANEEQAEIGVAFLSDLPFEYFETDPQFLKAYGKLENISEQVVAEVESIAQERGWGLRWEEIGRQNWNEEWEKHYFEPLTEAGFYVRAPFHPISENPEVVHTIVIQPRMSFGTGHHGTTQLMLKYIWENRTEILGKRVLDMGTGTGILAIAAAQVGAVEVMGVEIDDWVMDNANDNVEANQVQHVQMVCGTVHALKTTDTGYYDVVLANIHREVILADLSEYHRVLAPQGWMLLSGLQSSDEQQVIEAAKELGLQHAITDYRGEWICLQFRNCTQ